MRKQKFMPPRVGGDLTRDHWALFSEEDGLRNPIDRACGNLLLWLNGWEPLEHHLLKYVPFKREASREIYLQQGKERIPARDHNPESKARIIDLLELVAVHAEKCRTVDPPRQYFIGNPELDLRMASYATFPTLISYRNKVAIKLLTVEAQAHTDPSYPGTSNRDKERLKAPDGEVQAAHAIIDLCAAGLLDRIRRCECGDWFVAKREHGFYCSPRCRVAHHQKRPGRKDLKAARARQNYHHKEAQKAAARGEGKKAAYHRREQNAARAIVKQLEAS